MILFGAIVSPIIIVIITSIVIFHFYYYHYHFLLLLLKLRAPKVNDSLKKMGWERTFFPLRFVKI